MKPKIFILMAPMGRGHISVAEALAQSFELHYPGAYQVETKDISQLIGGPITPLLFSIHRYLSAKNPQLYSLIYQVSDHPLLTRFMSRGFSRTARSRLLQALIKPRPVAIISTFPTWNAPLGQLIKAHLPRSTFAVIVTDLRFTQRYWAAPAADYIFAGDEATAKSLRTIGVKPAQIKVFGYPVKAELSRPTRPQTTLQALDLPEDNFTILYLPTTDSLSAAQRTLQNLQVGLPDANIIVVTGRNQQLLGHVHSSRSHTRILGWTNNLIELIKASHVIVSKAGGVTVQECIAAERPMVITRAISGEEGNAATIKELGYGIWLTSPLDNPAPAVQAIQTEYQAYRDRLAHRPYPQAAASITNFLNQAIKESLT